MFLRGLGFVQGFVAACEIAAGILPVPIEEQTVETPIQIVMVRHIALGARDGIVLRECAQKAPLSAAHCSTV